MTAPEYAPGSTIDELPLFPLPQVVLFPGTQMPLHVFEPRYRSMTRDVLASNRQLSVVLIPEDHGMDAFGQPETARVASVGEIVRCDALPDGRFNILVEGRARVELEELPFRRPYRRARARILASDDCTVDPALVRALASVAARVARSVKKCHPAFRFCTPASCSGSALADICAHFLVLAGSDRQALLETLDVSERIQRCLDLLLRQDSAFGGGETMH